MSLVAAASSARAPPASCSRTRRLAVRAARSPTYQLEPLRRSSSGTTRSASAGGTKNSISICSNSRTRKRKFPGVISLRNDLPTCAIPNGGLRRASWSDVLEVDEDALRRLRAQVTRRSPSPRPAPTVRLEHEVELARLGQVALRRLAGPLLRPLAALRARLELVGAEAELAGAAVDERVGEARDVAGGLPDLRVEDDRRVERRRCRRAPAPSPRASARGCCPSAGRRSARSRRSSRARRRSPTTGRRSRAGGRARRSCPSSRRRLRRS